MGHPQNRLRRWLGPLPGRREAHVFSLIGITVGVLLCGWAVVLGFQGKTFLGRPLGGDFVQFYTVGKILNQYEHWRIYDLKLAVDLQHAIVPAMPQTQMLVFAQAPYIAWLFRPFALLPYEWAYVAWLGFSALVYVAALALVFRAAGLSTEDRKTGYLLAISSATFLFETWIGGQVSIVPLLSWALFFYLRSRNQPFLAGAALALLVFKPTLIAIPAGVLICGRLWRMAAGAATGLAALALLSLETVGAQGLRAWVDTMFFEGRLAEGSSSLSHLTKDVDANGFLHLAMRGAPEVATAVYLLLAVAGLLALATVWWRRPRQQDGLWAATLFLSLALAPYAPIYDAILVVPAMALLAGAGRVRDRETLAGWLLLLYMTPWITQSLAEFLHFQAFTVVLAAVGVWSLRRAASPEGLPRKMMERSIMFQQLTAKSEGNT